ncbi:MAG: MBL fold metallo-hydrolase, partial [Bacilli bacterium]
MKAMTAKEVTQFVLGDQPLFILDVRNTDAFTDWHIEGKNITHLNVPYFELIDGVDEILPQIPTNTPVLVVCAKEGSSIFVAEMLEEAGRSVSYLAGGMKSWSEYLQPVKIADLDGGALYQFVRMGKGCLSYFAHANGEALLVDATRMTDTYVDFAKELGVKITHVFDTHLHADHISGGRKIAEITGATYWLPPKDAEEVVFNYSPLLDGVKVAIGESALTIEALYSPGHTIGSTSFIINDQFLLSGDILFVDSIGRPDLAGLAQDWVTDLRETLYKRYREVSDSFVVLPA